MAPTPIGTGATAVTGGFEPPAEGCSARAFEARSFGHSDTSPLESLLCAAGGTKIGSDIPLVGEELVDESRTFGLADPADNFNGVVESPVAHDVTDRTAGPGFWIPCPEK